MLHSYIEARNLYKIILVMQLLLMSQKKERALAKFRLDQHCKLIKASVQVIGLLSHSLARFQFP